MNNTLPLILGAGLFRSQDKYPNMTLSAPRKVETYELEFFFTDGSTTVVEGRKYPIKSGSILLAKPGEMRYSHLPFTCHYIHFSVSDPDLAAILTAADTLITVPDTKDVRNAFTSISSLFCSGDPLDNIAAGAQLICLLHRTVRETAEAPDPLSRVRLYIQRNYARNLSTGDIAAACGISIPYLHKLLRNGMNTTPGKYLLSCRIHAARELLINTALPLQEIAIRCGFNSQSYFSDCFKRNVGTCPNTFRRTSAYPL